MYSIWRKALRYTRFKVSYNSCYAHKSASHCTAKRIENILALLQFVSPADVLCKKIKRRRRVYAHILYNNNIYERNNVSRWRIYFMQKMCTLYGREAKRTKYIVFYSNYMSRSRIEEDTTFIMDKKA